MTFQTQAKSGSVKEKAGELGRARIRNGWSETPPREREDEPQTGRRRLPEKRLTKDVTQNAGRTLSTSQQHPDSPARHWAGDRTGPPRRGRADAVSTQTHARRPGHPGHARANNSETPAHPSEGPTPATPTAPHAGRDAGQRALWHVAAGNAMWPGASEGSLAFCCKTKHTLTVNPAILFLVLYPKELKTSVHTQSCTWMFTAARFVKCPNSEDALQ